MTHLSTRPLILHLTWTIQMMSVAVRCVCSRTAVAGRRRGLPRTAIGRPSSSIGRDTGWTDRSTLCSRFSCRRVPTSLAGLDGKRRRFSSDRRGGTVAAVFEADGGVTCNGFTGQRGNQTDTLHRREGLVNVHMTGWLFSPELPA